MSLKLEDATITEIFQHLVGRNRDDDSVVLYYNDDSKVFVGGTDKRGLFRESLNAVLHSIERYDSK
ncbi:MAG: hypothetical protein ACFFG0_27740 [Candidatus Thorarchaeota archaeon]